MEALMLPIVVIGSAWLGFGLFALVLFKKL